MRKVRRTESMGMVRAFLTGEAERSMRWKMRLGSGIGALNSDKYFKCVVGVSYESSISEETWRAG